jgi:hypothetical protein
LNFERTHYSRAQAGKQFQSNTSIGVDGQHWEPGNLLQPSRYDHFADTTPAMTCGGSLAWPIAVDYLGHGGNPGFPHGGA